MFQFRAFPPYTYLIQCTVLEYCSSVLPHSEISGSTLICSSPKLFAACHVLHRLLMPRHSPCALYSLTCVEENCVSFSFSLQTRLRWALKRGDKTSRFPRSGSLSRIMQAQQNCLKTKLYLPLLKVPQLKFKLRSLRSRLSVALLFYLSSVQFSRCNFRCRGMVENSGIEPLTS